MVTENTTNYHCTPEELLNIARILLVYNVDLNIDYGPEKDTAIIRYGDISLTLAIIGERLSALLPRDDEVARVAETVEYTVDKMQTDIYRKILERRYLLGYTLAETCKSLGKNRLDNQSRTALLRFNDAYIKEFSNILTEDITLEILDSIERHRDPRHQRELRSILRGYVQHKDDLFGSIEERLLDLASQLMEELGFGDLNTKIQQVNGENKWKARAREMNYAPPKKDQNGNTLRYYRAISDAINDAVGYLLIDKKTGKIIKRSDSPCFIIYADEYPDVVIRPNYIDSQSLIFTLTNAAKNLGIRTPLLSEGSDIEEKVTLLCLFRSGLAYLKEADEVMGTSYYSRIEKDLTQPANTHRLTLTEDYTILSMLIYGTCFHRYNPFARLDNKIK